MTVMEVSAKVGKEGTPVTCKRDFGDDLDQMVALDEKAGIGDGVAVYTDALASRKIKVQDTIRAGINANKSPADIQKDVDGLKFGVRRKGKSKAEKMKDDFEKLTPDERKALLARLTAGAGK